MSEHDKENFEFIKEQVIEKKRKKLRKKLMPFFMTIGLAILFGLIAAVTFVLTEPRLYELLHKETETKTPAVFPDVYPEDSVKKNTDEIDNKKDTGTAVMGGTTVKDGITVKDEETVSLNNNSSDTPKNNVVQEKDTVIVEQQIDADIEDYGKMYEELRKVIETINRSIVTVIAVTEKEDVLFGSKIQMMKETTGLIVHNNSVELLVLTSLDRVETADSIKVKLSDTTSVNAVLQDYEKELNLAVVAIPLSNIPIAYMNTLQAATFGESYTLSAGNPIIAMGNPNGHVGSVDIGIITSCFSSIYITDNKLDLFNTDIINNENSDGIIVNLKGQIIGIITRTLKEDLNKDLSTAIGISKLKGILKNLLNKEPRIYFGVITEDMTDAAKREYEVTNGVYVNEVVEDSPAFNSGIQTGDIILQVDDYKISNTNDFYNTISRYQPEDEVVVKVIRTTGSPEREEEYTVTLAAKSK
jgi:serine protease Do